MENTIDAAIVQFLQSKQGQYVSEKLNQLLGDRQYLKGILRDNPLVVNENRFLLTKMALTQQIATVETEIGSILVAQVTIGQQEKQETPISETGI